MIYYTMNEAILFLNGKIDLYFCEQYIKNHLFKFDIFCADGAYQKIKYSNELKIKVKKIIGDFDSCNIISEKELLFIDYDQQYTDFKKSVNYLISLGFFKIFVFGASEGEMDHFLCNVAIAKEYYNIVNIEFIDIYSKYFFIPKRFIINNVKGKMFSIIPFKHVKNISYVGLKYNLCRINLNIDANITVRNYAIEDKVEIFYSSGAILLFISHTKYKNI